MIDLVAALWAEQSGLCICRRVEATPLHLVDDGAVVGLMCAYCAAQVRPQLSVRAERRRRLVERFVAIYRWRPWRRSVERALDYQDWRRGMR